MHRGDIVEITTVAGRAMTALILSDTAIAEPVGYVFIAPVLEALDALVGTEGTGAPVLTADESRLVGWITHRIILTAVQPPAEASSVGRHR
jgi:CBS domain-containing protein